MKSFDSYLRSVGGDRGLSYETRSISFENKNRKRFVLLIDDLHRCLQAIYENGWGIDKEFQGDWTYEESKYRTTFGRILEPLQPNTVSTSLGSQTPNTIRILELYAGYLLGKQPQKSLLIPDLLRPDELGALFSKHNLRKKFEDWLRETRSIGASSIKKYVSDAIGSQLSRIAEKDLYSVSSHAEFLALRQELEVDSEYNHIDREGHGMYSTALNHYSAFLETEPFNRLPRAIEGKDIHGYFKHEQLPISLLAKPFVILTGASGTGKTKLGESVAACFRNADESNVAKVAVGADWTDNRNVLGFVNHLKEVRGGPCYQSTPVLDLLLRATDHPDMPYFLILDEMNLSHVERYFSDFLSVMEQRDGCFDLHTSVDGQEAKSLLWRDENDLRGVPCQLNWPQNLFVIGTVNIDETTYMFSPKVLDRANVIEFKVDRNAMEGFLDEPTGYPPFENGGDELARGFLQLARQACIDDSDADGLERPGGNAATEIKRHLLALFDILQSGRFEYAFRTANEVLRYLRVCRHLAADRNAWDEKGWQTDLDDQILQKLLPKLHGSVGRVGPLLAGLSHYCHSGVSVGESGINMKTAVDLQCGDGTLFPKSLNKLKSMIRTLQDEQFVSFIQ